ncbi:MAG: folate family ECF transporter S component [Clostridiales bacterium]|nr:folate family ECF transporter S component [Clostridiales bacterium]
MSQKKSILFITLTAMLVAMQVVLGNILQVPFMEKQYNFGFQPILIAGWLLGAPSAMLVGALGDVIGSHLFPQGAYFPGFTLTNVLVGLCCGLILRRGKPTLLRVAITVVISMLINWLLNSLWLSITVPIAGGRSYWGWLIKRGPSYLVEIPANILIGFPLLASLRRAKIELK